MISINLEKIILTSCIFVVILGMIMVFLGIGGIMFTYKSIALENITTPSDASMPGVPVRGPFTLKSQADIIRTHMLKASGGKTYAEMPNHIAQIDAAGNPVLAADGTAVMVQNPMRNMWVTAITLTTALNLGIMAYILSAFIIVFGGLSAWFAILFIVISKKR